MKCHCGLHATYINPSGESVCRTHYEPKRPMSWHEAKLAEAGAELLRTQRRWERELVELDQKVRKA